jgi:hypothetical protein
MIIARNTGAVELYDRDRDLDEDENLAAVLPDVVAELADALDDWHRTVSERIYCRVISTGE